MNKKESATPFFEHRIRNFILEENLIPQEGKVLVALSGGADSVALLLVLKRLGYTCVAAHCNFHLRGKESDRDMEFVQDLCKRLSVELHVKQFDTQAFATEQKLSIEMAARELRYQWFKTLCKTHGYPVVAVAHHRDDSVETLLLNLIRGTGIHGLQGIKPKNGQIVRPLLGESRQEIEEYLTRCEEKFVTDSTNLKNIYIRNKIRLDILPRMEEINPSVKQSMAETASRISEAVRVYDQAIAEACRRVQSRNGNEISVTRLREEISPKAVLFKLFHPYRFTPAQLDDIYRCIQTDDSGKRFISPTHILLKDRNKLILKSKDEMETEETEAFTIGSIPSQVNFTPEKTLLIEQTTFDDSFTISKSPQTACVDQDKIDFPLTLRKVRQGDKFVPYGMNGKKTVSDYLTDKKYSVFRKQNEWVVTDNTGNIIWLVGERVDNHVRIIPGKTKGVIVMKLIQRAEL